MHIDYGLCDWVRLFLENFFIFLNFLKIQGKGYPDINTRAILKKISDDCNCPIYALVDADPYGIDIMLSYRHGSMVRFHIEN